MKTIKICLLGNPNCGKSTLFNALTGANQRVGNWPGVTVERKTGFFDYQQCRVEVLDLPGVYSLTNVSEAIAPDAQIACAAILSEGFDAIINIIDASNFERNFYLTTQLIAMQAPVIIVVNMLDVAQKRGVQIDVAALQKKLNCPVVGLTATKKASVQPLKKLIVERKAKAISGGISYPKILEEAINELTLKIAQEMPKQAKMARHLVLAGIEGDDYATQLFSQSITAEIARAKTKVEQTCGEEADILLADIRYSYAHDASRAVITKTTSAKQTFTERIDKIILNRILGIPIFLVAMYLMFFIAINIGGAFQPLFDLGSNAIFVQGFAQLLNALQVPAALSAMLASGLGGGINTVVTFIPVIGALFFFLSFLESSGYMARAAFVVDRCMRALGLPGKAFVPLIVGFGCNVPAMLATRTIDHNRDRLLTLMMSPFMSCGARMAIYAVFTAAFFPVNGQNIVFILYLLGILMAVATGFILRNTVLTGKPSPWIMELPPYHRPNMLTLLRLTWHRLRLFVMKAGSLIIPVCVLVSVLNSITFHGQLRSVEAKDSVLSEISQVVTPLFAPMGISSENWPATVGLVTGVLAKEVVVGTLNTLYTQLGNIPVAASTEDTVLAGLKAAVVSVPKQLFALVDSLANPVAASSGDASLDEGAMGVMYRYFDGPVGAMAYLLFVLLYFPCISAVAAMWRESSFGWVAFSALWTTGLAYVVATIFYQMATWVRHPVSSCAWVFGLSLLIALVLMVIKSNAIIRFKKLPARSSSL